MTADQLETQRVKMIGNAARSFKRTKIGRPASVPYEASPADIEKVYDVVKAAKGINTATRIATLTGLPRRCTAKCIELLLHRPEGQNITLRKEGYQTIYVVAAI